MLTSLFLERKNVLDEIRFIVNAEALEACGTAFSFTKSTFENFWVYKQHLGIFTIHQANIKILAAPA